MQVEEMEEGVIGLMWLFVAVLPKGPSNRATTLPESAVEPCVLLVPSPV